MYTKYLNKKLINSKKDLDNLRTELLAAIAAGGESSTGNKELIKQLFSTVTTIQNDYSTMYIKVNELSDKIDALTTQVATLTTKHNTDIAAVNKRIDDLKALFEQFKVDNTTESAFDGSGNNVRFYIKFSGGMIVNGGTNAIGTIQMLKPFTTVAFGAVASTAEETRYYETNSYARVNSDLSTVTLMTDESRTYVTWLAFGK